ncbi:MAG: hypothetical protein WCF84_20925, partial [Anaerolineae bacterium]
MKKMLFTIGLCLALGALLLLARVSDVGAAASTPLKAMTTRAETGLQETYGKLPLSFEANQGQMDAAVQFLSRGNGYSLYLTSSEAVLALRQPFASSQPETAMASPQVTVRMQIVGANTAAQTAGMDELPGKVNYLIGNDPAQWRTNIPTFGRVQYTNVYPGVDLAFYGNQRQIEYDFIVAPGADPQQIALHFDGVAGAALDGAGQLVLQTASGSVLMAPPFAYQESATGREAIGSRYIMGENGTVSFALDAYDTTRPLVVDPAALIYSTFLGGSSEDHA